jgi:uncharacterized protein (DUF2236 family)
MIELIAGRWRAYEKDQAARMQTALANTQSPPPNQKVRGLLFEPWAALMERLLQTDESLHWPANDHARKAMLNKVTRLQILLIR